MELFAKRVYDPVLKITQRSHAHAQNHVSVQRCHKSFTTIVLADHDFPLTGSNLGNLTAFRAIFRYIFTAYVQKRLIPTSPFDSLIIIIIIIIINGYL